MRQQIDEIYTVGMVICIFDAILMITKKFQTRLLLNSNFEN